MEGMYGAFQWIAELQISSRDRVSILPGDRLGFVGDRLIFWKKSSSRWRIVGKREIIVEEVVDEDKDRRVEGSSRKSSMKTKDRRVEGSSRKEQQQKTEVLLRKSTRIVEGSPRKSMTKDEGSSSQEIAKQQQNKCSGRSARSTDVHNMHEVGARSTARSTD